MTRKPNQAAKGTRKPKRTAQEVAAILAAPVPPDGIETFREGMREEADKVAEMVVFRLAEGKIDANAAAFILTANRRIVSKHESELQREEDERKLAEYKESDAHKTAEAVAQLAEGQAATRAAAERAADAAERAADLMSRLRPEWLTGEKKTPRQYLTKVGNVKMRIFDLWKAYEAEHDPEDNGGRKPDYSTFYEMSGAKEIRSGISLQSFIEDQAAKDKAKRTPEEIITRIIRSEGQRRRNADKKQKPKPRQKRTA